MMYTAGASLFLGQQRTMIPVTSPSVLKPPIFRVEVVEGVKAPISDELWSDQEMAAVTLEPKMAGEFNIKREKNNHPIGSTCHTHIIIYIYR